MQSSPTPQAPGSLELVRIFVNTLDIEAGTDALADVTSWTDWATAHGVQGRASEDDLERLRTLREALREALLANHDRASLPEGTRQALQTALEWCAAVPQFTVHGLELEPVGEGPAHVAGSVLAAVQQALADGSWSRLKACRDDTCHWAFYDHSRSRTGQWCSMQICGNRNKQARWRERQSSHRSSKVEQDD